MARVKVHGLEINKSYFFSDLKQASGVFKGRDKEGHLIFTPLILGNYSTNSAGFVNFESDDLDDWIECEN